MRNLLARVPEGVQAMVAATVRTIFDQPNRVAAEAQLLQVVEALGDRFREAVQLVAAQTLQAARGGDAGPTGGQDGLTGAASHGGFSTT
jgi:transposase-like protein